MLFMQTSYVSLLIATFFVLLSFKLEKSVAKQSWGFTANLLKYFLYFFSLALAFVSKHGPQFHIGFGPVNFVLEQIFDTRTLFMMPLKFQLVLMTSVPVETSWIWTLALLGFFGIWVRERVLSRSRGKIIVLFSVLLFSNLVLTLFLIFAIIGIISLIQGWFYPSKFTNI